MAKYFWAGHARINLCWVCNSVLDEDTIGANNNWITCFRIRSFFGKKNYYNIKYFPQVTFPKTLGQTCGNIASRWRLPMETFSALLALCAGNSPVTDEFPSQRPVTRNFVVFLDSHLNNGWANNLFERLSCSLWRHCNVFVWYDRPGIRLTTGNFFFINFLVILKDAVTKLCKKSNLNLT